MSRKKTPNHDKVRSVLYFPWLHKEIVKQLEDTAASGWTWEKSRKKSPITEYNTHIMGRFTCGRHTCPVNGWSSKMVAILIQRYADDSYNARVFNQRCAGCKDLGTFILNQRSYIERVSYRIKKWTGVDVEAPLYVEREGLPHRAELCEGCRRGICSEE